ENLARRFLVSSERVRSALDQRQGTERHAGLVALELAVVQADEPQRRGHAEDQEERPAGPAKRDRRARPANEYDQEQAAIQQGEPGHDLLAGERVEDMRQHEAGG